MSAASLPASNPTAIRAIRAFLSRHGVTGPRTAATRAVYEGGKERIVKLTIDVELTAGVDQAVQALEALFATKDRKSVLGTYSIDENGDTSLTDYGVYKIEGGELTFDKTVKAQT